MVMRWKTTLVLLAVTIGLGAYISLYELKQQDPKERRERAKRVVAIPPETVTGLTMDTPRGHVRLVREGTLWRLVPEGLRADPDRISQVLRETAWLIADRVLTVSPTQPLERAAFGLDPAVGRLTLVTDEASTTLLVGEETAVAGSRYVQVDGRPEIFVVPERVFEAIHQPAETFHDQRLIRLNPWTVEALAVTSAEVTYRLEQHDGEWTLTEPVEDRADRTEVTALLNHLSRLETRRLLGEASETTPPPTWGLETPRATVAVTSGEPTATTTLAFGRTLTEDDTLIAASRSDEPQIYAVAANVLDALLKDPSTLRAKDLAPSELPTEPSGRAPLQDESPGAQHSLDDGQVDENREQDEGPPEEISTKRTPGE